MTTFTSSKLDRVLADISSKAGEQITLEGLLDEWTRFVQEVERCYKLGAYDYVENLFLRDYLEEIVQSVEEPVAQSIRAILKPWDDRLRLATRKVERAVIAPANRTNFWWFRIPRTLSDELAADLRAEGTIP